MENLGEWDQTEDHPDFDPNLLNVESWGVDHQSDDVGVNINDQHHPSDDRNEKTNRSTSGNWGDGQWSATLGVTEFDHPEDITVPLGKQVCGNSGSSNLNSNTGNNIGLEQSSVEGMPNETVEAAVEAAVAAISETSGSVGSGDRSGGSSDNNAYNNITQHLHPLGIQSSASCPSPAYANAPGFLPQVQQQQQQQHTIQGLCNVGMRQPLGTSIPWPSTVSAVSGTAAAATPTIATTASATQHLSSLTANFMLAQAAMSSVAASAAAAVANATSPVSITPAQDYKQQNTASVISQASSVPNSKSTRTTKSSNTGSSRHRNSTTRQTKSTSKSRRKKNSANQASDANTGTASSSSGLPPFYLFDAPIELRANFMQNQRRLGLPIQHDPNSYHYGETVNGFHPHQYQLPYGAKATGTGISPPVRPSNAPPPQLIDARHGNYRKNQGGHVKNEREQKRAQKITELIEELRLNMEEGGWQVEARSKYHTLSNCAQYIKHMIKLTDDKENENQKLSSELDNKRRKIEREKEEKAIQEGRSDPESVTSSLTSDATICTSCHKQEDETSGESCGDGTKKRKLLNNSNRERGSSGDHLDNNNGVIENESNKKHRVSSSEATGEDSSGDDNRGDSRTGSGSGNSRTGSGSGGSGGISKTISSVSEMTDSNRGSSSNNSGSGGGISDDVPTEQDSRESTSGKREDGIDEPSTSSISSDAAVASEKTSRDHNTGHKDVVFNNDKRMSRKRPPEEVTSLERTFELNYEDVFHKSNIPQLIASTSGKIVTWNECFVKATGYRKSEIEQMTIFSLVKPENLANFFEIVAAALRPDDEEIAKEKNDDCEPSGDHEKRESEESSNSSGEEKNSKIQSHVNLSDNDTMIYSNTEKENGEQGERKNVGVLKNDRIDANAVAIMQKEEPSSKPREGSETENTFSNNSTNEESSLNFTEEERGSNSSVEDISGKAISKEIMSNSTEAREDTCDAEKIAKNDVNEDDINQMEKGVDCLISNRLLNYTAMTLPCIDFPAMKKRNQAAIESNSVIIPPLHVTVTLMSDKDPRRRCFHCVFTNSKGTNGSLGIITPELLASLFAKPLRNSRRKKHYPSHGAGAHQHQRKRARGGTTRIGQSVSTSTTKNNEQEHCVQHIVSTNDQDEQPPSPLLMPPPGPTPVTITNATSGATG